MSDFPSLMVFFSILTVCVTILMRTSIIYENRGDDSDAVSALRTSLVSLYEQLASTGDEKEYSRIMDEISKVNTALVDIAKKIGDT